MAIDGHTRTCGLIGNPVEHTLSPVIHNTLAELTNQNLCYVPLRVGEGCLEAAVKGAYALNILGLNVTVPYKSGVIPFLKDIDSLAEEIGAVNTLVRVDGGFKGYNTDILGLYRAMCSDGVKIEGEKVLLLGAGGVARAVAVLLAKKGASEIIIINRTLEKAQSIAEEVNRTAGKELAKAMRNSDCAQIAGDCKYLAIQATSVGMHPNDEDVVIADEDFYGKVHTGYDMIFNPVRTKFMRLVEAHGGRAFNGSKMLLYQGITAYELWTGTEVSDGNVSIVANAIMEALR